MRGTKRIPWKKFSLGEQHSRATKYRNNNYTVNIALKIVTPFVASPEISPRLHCTSLTHVFQKFIPFPIFSLVFYYLLLIPVYV